MEEVKRSRRLTEEKKEKNVVFSGHYVIVSSLQPKRQRPNDDRWNAARSCHFKEFHMALLQIFFPRPDRQLTL